ncbi:RagB/SusD family nutrient uptake outer membrane protein [Chitinophagaceae bacterium LB-8]|uniref:RagB/SusD family nutrient uptake outer membrane protein n=1 Tax=Paraflavisolibacter caeni TaxID=2982496 RepID=A0A9X3BGC6_9BACT|nr:RagB/SusD family nutrient uptake outer membrane protein [Paraflavisolibacter caeni]MCU7550689.1 RagB/SusD family nutrient uptake outer membrane protein [Paraflavisolibacter caeni]
MLTKYKTRVIAAFITTLLFTGSCQKFLDVPPQGQLTDEEIAGNLDAAEQLVNGVYNSLYLGGFARTTIGWFYSIATDVASDDEDKGSFDADFLPAKEIDNFTTTPTNSIINDLWTGYYAGIVRANQTLQTLEESTFEEAIKNQFLGEVRFIRGMYYFNLVRLFGGVPKIIRVPDATEGNSDEFQTRASAAEIYQVVIDDLQFAVDNLAQKGDPNTEVGRATKGAAQALLAKVYMYQKNWQKVFDLTKEVINSGKYSLADNYASNFIQTSTNTSESIFEVQTGNTANCDGVSPLYSNGQGPRSGGKGGWNDVGLGFNNPSESLLAAYEPNDKRRDASIIFIQPTVTGGPNPGTILWDGLRLPTKDSVENLRYNYKAYASVPSVGPCAGNKDKKPKNIVLMRYAEVLLMYAEAAAMLGNSGEALAKLNLVRKRAGLTDATTATQQDIWKERRVELAMEQDRFFDLVRQGRAGQVLRAHGKAFVDNKNEIYPIPQAQIDLSGHRLAQNPNY